jgi:hypothetical protein
MATTPRSTTTRKAPANPQPSITAAEAVSIAIATYKVREAKYKLEQAEIDHQKARHLFRQANAESDAVSLEEKN